MPEHVYDDSEMGRELNAVSVDVLKTDLNTALTFARIAQNSKDDPEKKNRNQANARKAYDTVLDYQKRLELTDKDKLDISEKLRVLRSAVTALGEVF
jgi:hypothetical protein